MIKVGSLIVARNGMAAKLGGHCIYIGRDLINDDHLLYDIKLAKFFTHFRSIDIDKYYNVVAE